MKRAETETRRCGALPMIENSVLIEYNNSYVVGDAVNISCLPGYVAAPVIPSSAHLSGRHDDAMTSLNDESVSAFTVMCQDDLTWSAPQHVCRSMCTAMVFLCLHYTELCTVTLWLLLFSVLFDFSVFSVLQKVRFHLVFYSLHFVLLCHAEEV